MTKPNDRDTTIGDIHRTRERLAAKFGHDINAILADARRRQAESGHPVWQGKPAGKPFDGPDKPGSPSRRLTTVAVITSRIEGSGVVASIP